MTADATGQLLNYTVITVGIVLVIVVLTKVRGGGSDRKAIATGPVPTGLKAIRPEQQSVSPQVQRQKEPSKLRRAIEEKVWGRIESEIDAGHFEVEITNVDSVVTADADPRVKIKFTELGKDKKEDTAKQDDKLKVATQV